MKLTPLPRWLSLLAIVNFAVACQEPRRGTPGSSFSETGTVRGDGTIQTAPGASRPFQHTGMPDEVLADSRAEASLETSGAGSAEIARRSATPRLDQHLKASATDAPGMKSDRDIFERIQKALSSSSPNLTNVSETESTDTLNHLRIGTHNGVVTLRGPVHSLEDKLSIESRVRTVPGVTEVLNELIVLNSAESSPLPSEVESGADLEVPDRLK